MMPSNFHTHTRYCDGNDTPEELILEAIKLGCKEIGFSGHSFLDLKDDYHYVGDLDYCMSKDNTQKYKKEIRDLKHKYKDQIKVYLGIEQDIFSEESTEEYDYVIGSVHYVKKNGHYLVVDMGSDIQKSNVDIFYNGDFYAFAEDYFETVSTVYEKTKCDIIGHFDLISKYNEDNLLFDRNNPRYINAARKALDKLLNTPASFEINYGAISRGYRITPYPEKWMIEYIEQHNGRLIKTSDCHDKKDLLLGLK